MSNPDQAPEQPKPIRKNVFIKKDQHPLIQKEWNTVTELLKR